MLAQTRDETNLHLTSALHKLIEALPPSISKEQQAIAALLFSEEEGQPDLSSIFHAVASGWILRRKVHLNYEPPHKRPFDTLFDPYLIEPSAIGHTMLIHLRRAMQNYGLESEPPHQPGQLNPRLFRKE